MPAAWHTVRSERTLKYMQNMQSSNPSDKHWDDGAPSSHYAVLYHSAGRNRPAGRIERPQLRIPDAVDAFFRNRPDGTVIRQLNFFRMAESYYLRMNMSMIFLHIFSVLLKLTKSIFTYCSKTCKKNEYIQKRGANHAKDPRGEKKTPQPTFINNELFMPGNRGKNGYIQ